MLKTNVKKTLPLLAGLLLAVLAWGIACAAPVQGVTVEVRNHEGSFIGDNLLDGDISTAWVGGGKGIGPGKWIEFVFPAPVRLESIKIANGHQGTGRFERYRRIIRGVILYPDETRQKFTLRSAQGVQTVRLEPKVVTTFRIIITGVAPDARDKDMAKAKVAVSEMTIFGELTDEPVVGSEEKETSEHIEVVEEKAAIAKPESTPKSIKSETKTKKDVPVASVTPTVAAKKKKAVPAPKMTASKNVQSESRAQVKEKPKPKPKAKSKSKPKAKVKSKPKSKGVATPVTYLRPATQVPPDKALDAGVISPWLDLEVVAQIKRYFFQLTTLGDEYSEVFASSIRERERKLFLALQEDVRAEKMFGKHSISMPELIGLSFDKPEGGEDSATLRVHGPYRYYLGDQVLEVVTDTRFSLVRTNGKWLISDVRDK